MHGRHLLRTALLAAFLFAGCGGDENEPAAEAKPTPKGPPPAAEVQESMVAIIDTCTEASFDENVDTAPVSEQVDRMISLFEAHDPDATMKQSDLRATTMRQVLTQVRDHVRTCSPQDEERINDTLTSVPAPADAQPAPTSESEPAETNAGGRRGVATIASELASLCVDKLGDPGPASPEIEELIDDLVTAYQDGPKNAATRNFMRVAHSNMREGCGPDQADKVKQALDAG